MTSLLLLLLAATPPASPLLDPQHPSVQAMERLDELGLLGDVLPAQRAVPAEVVERALRDGVQRAKGTPYEQLTRDLLARHLAEFRRHDVRPGVGLTEAKAGIAGSHDGYSLLPYQGTPPVLTPPLGTHANVRARLAAGWAPWVAAQVTPQIGTEGFGFPEWEVLGAIHHVTASIGRAPISYGFARSGGIVSSGLVALDRIELQTAEPYWIHGRRRPLWPVAVHLFLARMNEARHPGNPYLLGVSAKVKLHPRLVLSAQRSVMYGGGVQGQPTNPFSVFEAIGALRNDGENNVASGAFRYRLPTDAWLPLVLHGEWGIDDSAGGQLETPGIVAGLRAPAIPGLPQLGVGFEYAFFGQAWEGRYRRYWYLHNNQIGGWTSQSRMLGHPVGGNGREARLHGTVDLLDATLHVEFDVYRRLYDTLNLYQPALARWSNGAKVVASWRIASTAELTLNGDLEVGRGWHRREFAARANWFF